MKKTIILSLGLALCAGITSAQTLQPVVTSRQVVSTENITNAVTAAVSAAQFDGIAELVQAGGIGAAATIRSTNTASFSVSPYDASNQVYHVTVRAFAPRSPGVAFVPTEQQFCMTASSLQSFCTLLGSGANAIASPIVIGTNNFNGCSGVNTSRATKSFAVRINLK